LGAYGAGFEQLGQVALGALSSQTGSFNCTKRELIENFHGRSCMQNPRDTLIARVDKSFFVLAALFLLPAIPLSFLGFGSDNDSYGELDAGKLTWAGGTPTMSRHPGYWLHEFIVYLLNNLGGSLLTNICTVIISLLILYRFWVIASILEIQWRFPLALCLAWNPWYLIASTSTIDYLWAVLFIVFCIEAFLTDKSILSGIFGGVATGFRLGSIFTISGALLFSLFKKFSFRGARKPLIAVSLASFLGLIFYIPSWITVGENLTFLQGHLGSDALWTLKMHIGRVLYKPLYLFGIIADLLLLCHLFINWKRIRGVINDHRDFVKASIGAVIGTSLLYAKYPIEESYLLPAVPFLLILIGISTNGSHRWLPWSLVIASVSFWFVSFPLATPNHPGQASSATIGMRIETGVLVADIENRLKLIDCNSMSCYTDKITEQNGR
jgi:hypothetical protein